MCRIFELEGCLGGVLRVRPERLGFPSSTTLTVSNWAEAAVGFASQQAVSTGAVASHGSWYGYCARFQQVVTNAISTARFYSRYDPIRQIRRISSLLRFCVMDKFNRRSRT